jgi:hypothetical protein
MYKVSLIRIISDPIPGYHQSTDSTSALLTILKDEPDFLGVTKIWILNNLVKDTRKIILASLKEFGHKFIEVKNGNPQNINHCRNLALATDFGSDYKLIFDEFVYLSYLAWDGIQENFYKFPSEDRFLIPMVRLRNFKHVDDEKYVVIKEESTGLDGYVRVGLIEPQVAFSNAVEPCFDESCLFGSGSKVELLQRWGIPGPWMYHTPKFKSLYSDLREVMLSGFCYRLPSTGGVGSADFDYRNQIKKAALQRINDSNA